MTGELRVVIVGGGLGAVRSAQTLRDLGHRGPITILSAESEIPYDRPPLSKDHLAGALPEGAIALLPADGYADLDVSLELGRAVVALDTSTRTVATEDGAEMSYDRLVIATGARARVLPVLAEEPEALALRTATDSHRLAAAVRDRRRIAVVGGGFIGLEVAATARTAGCAVTVVEAQPAPLLAAVGPAVAGWLQARHTARGVGFRCGSTVAAAGPAPDGGVRLDLTDGSVVDADTVLVGVGVFRDVGWLASAGLETADGLVCDADGRTSHPDVFGVGDVVCHRTATGTVPVAHWTATGNSARRSAYALLGRDAPRMPDDGYFWSDQFDMRLQSVGRVASGSEMTVVAGDMEGGGSFVAQFHTGGHLGGVIAVNEPRQFLRHRRALQKAPAG